MDSTNRGPPAERRQRRYVVDAAIGLLLPVALVAVFWLDSSQRLQTEGTTADSNLLSSSASGPGFDGQGVSDSPRTGSMASAPSAETPAANEATGEDPQAELNSGRTRDGAQTLAAGKPDGPKPAALVAQEPGRKIEKLSPNMIANVKIASESIYSTRSATNRQQQTLSRGGSQISEQAVQDGLVWLARHQAQDGRWSSDNLSVAPRGCCEPAGTPCNDAGGRYDAAHTGLALLAFQGGGYYYFNDTPYSDNVRRGLDWLVSQQKFGSALSDGGMDRHTMYSHGIAAFAVCEACALAVAANIEPDPRYLRAAKDAVKFIEKAQHGAGGWRYSPGQAGDTSVSGWQILALKTANEAKIPVSERTLELAVQFFRNCEMPDGKGRTGYTCAENQSSEATTGVGMLVHQFLRQDFESPLIKQAAPYLADYVEGNWSNGRGKPDYYLWYNCTLAMFQVGGDYWKRWNDVIRERLIALQRKEGCERGSWPPVDEWGSTGGRIYSTALAVLTLEVYYRFADQRKEIEHRKLVREYLQKSEDSILAALTHEDPSERWAAVSAAREKKLDAADQLILLLRDPAAGVREDACRALIDLADGIHHSEPPGETKEDQDRAVDRWTQWNARRKLLAGFSGKSPEDLVEAMTGGDEDRRWAAAVEAKRQRLDLAEEFLTLLGDADPSIRRESHQALVQLAGGADYGATDVDADAGLALQRWTTWCGRRKLLPEFAGKNRERLVAAFSDPAPERRWAAVAVVRQQRLHAPVQLIAMLHDADTLVREEAHLALAQFAPDVDFGPALGDPPAQVAEAAEKWSNWWAKQVEKREQQAENALRMAEILKEQGRTDSARKRFQQIVDEYPETKAAAAAAKRLEIP